jgi:hypothetical protein
VSGIGNNLGEFLQLVELTQLHVTFLISDANRL